MDSVLKNYNKNSFGKSANFNDDKLKTLKIKGKTDISPFSNISINLINDQFGKLDYY